MKRNIIIDTDPGVDDITALLVALYNKNLNVKLITSTAGNVGIEKTTRNILHILEKFNFDIPVCMAVRKEADRAILQATGYGAVETGCIDAGKYRLIINTVPAPVLDDDAAKKDAVWIDLASKKGIFGENVLWARSLPGKDAPESSGELIARTVLRYLGKEQL